MTNPKFDNPLHSALKGGHPSIARAHIELSEFINDQDENGDTPLHLAILYKDVFELLLKSGADANAPNNQGETPLHKVTEFGSPAHCKMLIDAGAKTAPLDNKERIPLHYAANYGNHDIVKFLIVSGADVNAVDINGRLPIHNAVQGNIWRHELENYVRTVEVLIQAGSDLNAKTNKRETPLDLAKGRYGHEALATLLIQHGAK